jgi:hypothetical protein
VLLVLVQVLNMSIDFLLLFDVVLVEHDLVGNVLLIRDSSLSIADQVSLIGYLLNSLSDLLFDLRVEGIKILVF